MSRNLALLACSCLVLSFVPQDAPHPQSASQAQTAGAPWVLHAPFEGRSTMIVLALDPHVFVAYDASTCGYSMAWTQGLSFREESAFAGPLPIRRGEPCSVGVEGCPWEVRKGGTAIPIRAHYRGCRFEGQQVFLAFELELEDRSIIRVEEAPEVLDRAAMDELWNGWTMGHDSKWPDEFAQLRVLRRSFVVDGLPKGHELCLRYARTVATMTGTPGFRGERAPQGNLDRNVYESILLTFEDLAHASIVEGIEP